LAKGMTFWIIALLGSTAIAFMAAFFLALLRETRVVERQRRRRAGKKSLTLAMLDRYRNDRAA